MRRRTKGEGTVFEQRPGYWVAQVRHDGKRLSGSGRTSTDARRAVAAKVAEAERRARERIDDQQTLAAYLDTWLRETKHSLRPSAWRKYESIVRVHIAPRLGALRLDELDRTHLTEFFEGLRAGSPTGRPQSDTSCHHIHATLRKALEDAVDQGLIVANVARRYPAPRMVHRDKVILDEQQVARLLRAAIGDPLEALYVLAVTTGMREGELLGLRWQHIDLAAGRLTVAGSAGRGYDGKLVVGETKTRTSRRTIELTPIAVEALIRHKAISGSAGSNDLVFRRPGTDSRPIDGVHLLRHQFWPLLARAGLPRMPFHDLRHSAITMLLEADVQANTVSEMAGHADVATTLRIYGHVTPKMRRAAASVMQGLVGGSQSPVEGAA